MAIEISLRDDSEEEKYTLEDVKKAFNAGLIAMHDKLIIGKTEGPISGSWGTFGRLLTLNEFKTYILKEKNQIYELW